MGRTQRVLTSFVGAIPAGFLAYLLVMVFLNNSDKLSTALLGIVGLTLACAAVVMVMPFGILLARGKKASSDNAAAVSKKGSAKVVEDDDSDEVAVADEEIAEEEAEEIEEDSAADFDIDGSDSSIMADSDDEITGSASSLDEIESVDFDDDDDEPPAPKKRR